MNDRLSQLPFGVDQMVFDGLQYHDLVNMILLYPRYRTRQDRIENGLENYLRLRFINDFIGGNIYNDIIGIMDNSNNKVEEDIMDVLKTYEVPLDFHETIEMYLQSLGDLGHSLRKLLKIGLFNVDPLFLYMVMSNVVNTIYKDKPLDYPPIILPRDYHLILLSVLNVLNFASESHLSFEQQDVDDFIWAYMDAFTVTDFDNIVIRGFFDNPQFANDLYNFKYNPSISFVMIQVLLNKTGWDKSVINNLLTKLIQINQK